MLAPRYRAERAGDGTARPRRPPRRPTATWRPDRGADAAPAARGDPRRTSSPIPDGSPNTTRSADERSDCPPFRALAAVSGVGSDEFVDGPRWRGGRRRRRPLRRSCGRLDDARDARCSMPPGPADRGCGSRSIRRTCDPAGRRRRFDQRVGFEASRSMTAPMPMSISAITTGWPSRHRCQWREVTRRPSWPRPTTDRPCSSAPVARPTSWSDQPARPLWSSRLRWSWSRPRS